MRRALWPLLLVLTAPVPLACSGDDDVPTKDKGSTDVDVGAAAGSGGKSAGGAGTAQIGGASGRAGTGGTGGVAGVAAVGGRGGAGAQAGEGEAGSLTSVGGGAGNDEGGATGTGASGGTTGAGAAAGVGGEAGQAPLSRTGWVVYRAAAGTDPAVLLGSRLVDGVPEETVTLSDTLPADHEVAAVTTLPGRHAVIYAIRPSPYGMDQIFLLDLSTTTPGTPIRINSPLGDQGALGWWTPDASEQRISYTSQQDADTGNDLVLVNLGGATPSVPHVVNPRTTSAEDVDFSWWLRTSLLYTLVPDRTANTAETAQREVMLADAKNTVPGASSLVSNDGSTGLGTAYPWPAPNAERLIYYRKQYQLPIELFLVTGLPGSPSSPKKLDGALVTADNFMVGDWSPDSAHFIYRADAVSSQLELFLLDETGTNSDGATRLNTSLPADVSVPIEGKWSPDSNEYAYLAAQTDADRVDLWVVNIKSSGPSAPRLANGTMVSGGSVDPFNGAKFDWSPDSKWIGFIADALQVGVHELFLAPVTTSGVGERVRINTALPSVDADVADFWFSPDGQTIFYAADQLAAGARDLYSVSLAGSAPAAPKRLSRGTAPDRNNYGPAGFVGSSELLFTDLDGVGQPARLELAPIDGSAAPTTLSPDGVDASGSTVWLPD